MRRVFVTQHQRHIDAVLKSRIMHMLQFPATFTDSLVFGGATLLRMKVTRAFDCCPCIDLTVTHTAASLP